MFGCSSIDAFHNRLGYIDHAMMAMVLWSLLDIFSHESIVQGLS
jgi:hypothetical protein